MGKICAFMKEHVNEVSGLFFRGMREARENACKILAGLLSRYHILKSRDFC
jgi:hypothetical protein